MSANTTAAIVHDYQKDRTLLIYPDGELVGIAASDDRDSLIIAHIRVYNLPLVDASKADAIGKYSSQLTTPQFDAFVAKYPGKKNV